MRLSKRRFLAYLSASATAISAGACGKLTTSPSDDWPGPQTPRGQFPTLPIGMNLAGIADWEPGFPFRNLMWGARPWLTRDAEPGGPWNTNTALLFDFDLDGYPLEVPIVAPGRRKPQQIFTLLPNVCKPGRYTLYHDGIGRFEAFLGTKILSTKPGELTLEMQHKPGLVEGLAITESRRENHLRNIRILAEGDPITTLTKQPFLTEFLDFCRPFHALRFMDWASINNSIEEGWETRRRPSFYTMVGGSGDADGIWGPKPTSYEKRFSGGVAVEVMLQLANHLRSDPWLCIPHRATDDYIENLAKLTHEILDPDRRVYVEFSNEIWNWQFKQAHWMLRSSFAAKKLEEVGVPAWKSGPIGKEGINHPERIGALFTRAFDRWTKSWPREDASRCITVCSVQASWSDAARRTIDWCADHGSATAVSASGYFALPETVYEAWEKTERPITVEEVAHELKFTLDDTAKGGSALIISNYAHSKDLAFLVYEGGQHLVPRARNNNTYYEALKDIQTSRLMFSLYVYNLRIQKRLGCSLFCAFSSVSQQGTKYGSWGAKSSYQQSDRDAPKYMALLQCNSPRYFQQS